MPKASTTKSYRCCYTQNMKIDRSPIKQNRQGGRKNIETRSPFRGKTNKTHNLEQRYSHNCSNQQHQSSDKRYYILQVMEETERESRTTTRREKGHKNRWQEINRCKERSDDQKEAAEPSPKGVHVNSVGNSNPSLVYTR